jgi:SNF2 family DNA or RNA helicase
MNLELSLTIPENTPPKVPKSKPSKIKKIVYGEAILKETLWHISVKPHVMIRLKRTITKINSKEIGTVTLSHTPENAADLLWFTQRYPIKITPLKALKQASDAHFKHVESIPPLLDGKIEPIDVELALPARKYQRIAIDLGRATKNLLIADTLGLGKTICGIGMASFSDSQPAVIVVKANLPLQWQRQFEKFLPDLKTHIIKTGKHYTLPSCPVYIITYHKLGKWAEHFTEELGIKLLVFDEAQELRRTGSDKYNAAKHLSRHTNQVIGLSATPIYNYGDEIFNVLDIINPNCLGTRSEFIREWCTNCGTHYKVKHPNILGEHLRTSGFMIRRTLKDVGMEAPAYTKIIEDVPCDPSIIKKMEDEAIGIAKIIVAGSFHEQGQASREFNLKMRMATGIAKAPYVAAIVDMMVEQYGKVLLTGWHREVYSIWEKQLAKHKPVFYTGSETIIGKDKSAQEFIKGDSNVLIMSLRSAEGLDGLQHGCSTVIHGELDWTLKIHEQVLGRVLRPGQENPVIEMFLIAENGSDPFMCHINGIKAAQSTGILETTPQREIDVKVEMGRIKEMAIEFLKKKNQYTPPPEKINVEKTLIL